MDRLGRTIKRARKAAGLTQLELGLAQIPSDRKPLPSTPIGRELEANRAAILQIIADHGGSNAWVFGSVARGEDREGSDLDLLVDLPARTSILKLGAIAREVEELVGLDVDVVPEPALRADTRGKILAEAIRL